MRFLVLLALLKVSAIASLAATGTLSLMPDSAVLPTRGRLVFQIKGATARDCLWTSTGGEVDLTGAYFAPETSGTFTVRATLATDSSVIAEAEVKVIDVPFGGGEEEERWQVSPGEVFELPATIPGMEAGLSNRILWALEKPDCGAVLTRGCRLTAPKFGHGCVVVGRSEADPSRIRRIALSVIQPDSELGVSYSQPTEVRVTPTKASVRSGSHVLFVASVSNASSEAVSWTVDGTSEDASIDRTGIFTATRPGIYRVTATSLSNPSCRGSAEVDVEAAIEATPNPARIPQAKGAFTLIHVGGFQVAQVGGWSGTDPLNSVVLWDSQAEEKLRLAGNMQEARLMPLGASLGGGRILVCNGVAKLNGADALLRSAELVDLSTGVSRLIAPPPGETSSTRYAHCGGSIINLKDGRVLLLGGDDGNERHSGAEVYEPVSETFSLLDPDPFPSDAATVLLPDGSVLIFGGRYQGGKTKGPSDAIIAFDPRTELFKVVGRMALPRSGHTSTLLVDGRVLIAGGRVQGRKAGDINSTKRCEIFDPRTGRSVFTGEMSEPREGHAAVLMPTGQVLCLGGFFWNGGVRSFCATIEAFDLESKCFSIFDHPRSGIVNPALFILPDGSTFTGGTAVEFNPARNTELSNPCH